MSPTEYNDDTWRPRAVAATPCSVGALLTTRQVADYLQVPVKTVRQWRYRGVGPRGTKLGRHVRYAMTDLVRWIETRSDQQVAAS